MPDAQRQTVREALREETRTLVLGRMQWVLYVSIAGLALSALSDVRLSPPPYDLILVKLAGAVLQGAAVMLIVLVRNASWTRSMAVTVGAWSLACAITSFNGSYTGDPLMPTLLLPVMVVGAGVVFPWGVIPQLAVVILASVSLLPHAPALGTNLIVSGYSVFAASIYVASTFERQQRKRKAIELLQAGQQRVLERIMADEPLASVCTPLLETMRQQMADGMCALMRLEQETETLRCVATAGLSSAHAYAIDALAVATSADPSAVAARTGARMIVNDVTTHGADAHGGRAVWVQPIVSADRSVLGVIAVYRPRPGDPSDREVRLLEMAARLFGMAIERRETAEQLTRYLEALDGARIQAERQAEELAHARDQALASMRARSQFLANMSHEIRTPLNGIIGTTEILLDTELSETQRDYARIVSRCGEHLLGVINDILDLSKIEAGKVEIEHLDLDLRALIEEVADALATRALEKGIELASSIPPELDTGVRGDASRLRQVLVNLVGNAIKFTERGEVVIEARALRQSATRITVRLAVRDTGIGIPLHRQGAVFESFTQADGSTTRTYGGSGLGLTICKQLAEMMGGAIGLESTPGEGSTFWADLPFDRAPAAAERRPAPVCLAGLRVLVVDDTPTNRMIVRWSLEAWGCRVDEAASGREALAVLEASPGDAFGLMILDMKMPELDGVATTRAVKANARLAHLPIILLSSIGGLRGGEREARAIGFAAAITKPIRQAALLDAILGALGEAARQPARHTTPAAGPARVAALRVLLAEDSRVNQLVAQRLLEKLGCHTDVVENGRDAVHAVVRARYDVVLMDIQMPLMDGFQATAEIRRAEVRGERLPIIAMTAHAMEGDRKRCLDAGMDGYVSKPITLAALADALADVSPYGPNEAGADSPGVESPPLL